MNATEGGGDSPGPIPPLSKEVQPDWVDEYGVLLPAYHVVILDHAVDVLFNTIGIGWAYRDASNFGTFAVETHTIHRAPLGAGERVTVQSYILAVDEKRLHHAHAMFRQGEAEPVSFMEQMTVHVDLEARRTAPLPAVIVAQINDLKEAQSSVPPATAIGRKIGLLYI